MIREIRAAFDPTWVAALSPPFALRYARGGSHEDDHPAFARAASAIRRWQGQRVIVQDDVNVLALAPIVADGAPLAPLHPLLLPPGEAGRRTFDSAHGNKRSKLDLEAALVLPDGRLLAFGSGSLPARERLVLVEPGKAPVVRDARALYRALRRRVEFAGSELNIEGALVRSGTIELFQRGNGASAGTVSAVNAMGTLPLDAFLRWLDGAAPPPELQGVLRVELGRARGVPLGFTDATLAGDGSIAFLACAEASLDAVADGEVVGVCMGLLQGEQVRLIDVIDEHGRPCLLELEGIEARPDDPSRFDVVADVDDPSAPALGATLELRRR